MAGADDASFMLATVSDVSSRLEDELDEHQLGMVAEYIGDASDSARHYGSGKWMSDNCPRVVRRIVAAAVARFMRNPDGLTQSRAADETLAWEDPDRGPEFTDEEIARIRKQAAIPMRRPNQGFSTAQFSAWGDRRDSETIYTPWGTGDSKPFPFIQINDSQGLYRWED